MPLVMQELQMGGTSQNGTKPCPVCGKPSVENCRPFCSDRCKDVDLNRWLSGTYAIPGRQDEGDDAD
jgi:uncharacterized protein